MADYKSEIYAEKKAPYFQGIRPEVVALIPGTNNRVIELGCGAGRTLLGAREAGKASEIVGIDIIDRLPQHDLLTRYYQGDIDTLPLDMEQRALMSRSVPISWSIWSTPGAPLEGFRFC